VRSFICFISNEYDKIKCFKKSFVGYIVGWTPEIFSCLAYIVGCGYPTRTRTHTRGNSVAHVWLQSIFGRYQVVASRFLAVTYRDITLYVVNNNLIARTIQTFYKSFYLAL